MIIQESPKGIYRIPSLGKGVLAGFSSRFFGNDQRREFLEGLSLQPENLVMVKQIHEAKILVMDEPRKEYLQLPADGIVTKTPGLVLGIRTADCVPVFFWDPVQKVAGIAHGGWKGIKKGIMSQMLKVFSKEFKTKITDLKVAIGPSIRKCCYEVGKEFLGYFPGFYHARDANKGYLDLVGAIKRGLIKKGILPDQIEDTEICTVCENKNFFSYRAENQTKERILNIISILRDREP